MKIDFAKLHGLGNDFVMIDDFSREIDLTSEQVRFLCDRHFGIGADGVILVRPSQRSECAAYMHYINSDGTLAQMCGNGVRCFAKYLVDRGFVAPEDGSFVADTLAGPRPISFTTDSSSKLIDATVDMGRPILVPSDVPVALDANAQTEAGTEYCREVPLESPWGTFAFTCVSMGNPHAITFIEDFSVLPDELFMSSEKSLASLDLNKVGAFFEAHPAFPEKTNVEFVTVDESYLSMRVYERGCGETLACGTGTCATSVAAYLTGRASRVTDVKLLGGTLHIEINDENHVMMTGPAQQSFRGTVKL